MRISTALISIFWIYVLADAYLQGLEIPGLLATISVPEGALPWIVTSLIALFTGCLLVTFSQRRRLMEDLPLVTRWVDSKFGEGTYMDFSRRLRPVAVATLSSSVLAISSLRATYATTKSLTGYLAGAAFSAIALGLLVAYLLSRRYPPKLQ